MVLFGYFERWTGVDVALHRLDSTGSAARGGVNAAAESLQDQVAHLYTPSTHLDAGEGPPEQHRGD